MQTGGWAGASHHDTCMCTGQLPALERETQIAGIEEGALHGAKGVLNEFHAARTCIAFAQQHLKDLDQNLTTSQRAELLAYSVLIETRLEVATMVSAWCEPLGFAELRKVRPSILSSTIESNMQGEPWLASTIHAGETVFMCTHSLMPDA